MADSWGDKKGGEWGWDMPEGMDPMKVMQVASAYWDSCVLHAANRLNVFSILDEGSSEETESFTVGLSNPVGADQH